MTTAGTLSSSARDPFTSEHTWRCWGLAEASTEVNRTPRKCHPRSRVHQSTLWSHKNASGQIPLKQS